MSHSWEIKKLGSIQKLTTVSLYYQVLVPKLPHLMGRMFKVRIVDSCKFSMTGELVDETAVVSPALAAPLDQGQVSGVRKVAEGGRANRISSNSGLVGISVAALLLGVAICGLCPTSM